MRVGDPVAMLPVLAVAYVALLRSMGCTSTPKASAAAGDEIDIGRLGFAAQTNTALGSP